MAAIDKSLYEKFIIESVDGSKTADISAGVVSFNYYENLFSPMVTGKVVVVNTGNTIKGDDGKMQSLYNGFPLRGGERVVIKVSGNSPTNKGLDFSDNPSKYLYVGSITNVIIKEEKETFTLNLVSREAITNETVRVGKRFPTSQKISDSVKNIVEQYLASDKLYDIDETQNPYGFIGNMKKPFTILTWLASKSVPAGTGAGATAGYFFFETQKGFRYKSIDELIDQDPYEKKYTYTPGIVEYKGPENDFKILEYSTSRNQNLLENLERGAYCSHRKYLNPLTFEYTPAPQTVFKLNDYSGKIKNLGGDIDVTLPSLSDKDNRNLASVPSRYITGILDIGTIENEVSTNNDNADPTKIHSQAMMRYNILFTQLLVMTIPLNTNLMAGDVIDCNFPRIDSEQRKEIDRHQSGLYMIKEVVHYFDSSGSYSKLKLVRDTFGVREK